MTRRWWPRPSSSSPRQGPDPRACSVIENGPMTQQPISAAFLRGAVDLSSLGRPAAAPSAAGAADPIVTQGTDANFNDIVSASMNVPSVVVLWSQGLPASGEFVDVVADRGPLLRGPLPGRLGRRRRQPRAAAGLPGAVRAGDARPHPGPAGAAVRRGAVGRARPRLRRRAAQARRAARRHRPRRHRCGAGGGRRGGAAAAAAAPAGVRGDRARRPRRRRRRLPAGAEGEPRRCRGVRSVWPRSS